VVADDEDHARQLAAGYGAWVLSIRNASGAIPYPTPAEARAHVWCDEDRELVADRLATQFVGTAAQVVAQLRRLEEATGADELVITTITHDHLDRVRSYELLAEEWYRDHLDVSAEQAGDPLPGGRRSRWAVARGLA
jgi:alkanesulfonate monooxygenase SsuD/methylene tetrahydromethanopterin reductase-like flavin-dependent oxidoreductase (luciferase family)